MGLKFEGVSKPVLPPSLHKDLTCPHCGAKNRPSVTVIYKKKYWGKHVYRYCGYSECECTLCGTRWGYRSGEILADGEYEPPPTVCLDCQHVHDKEWCGWEPEECEAEEAEGND